ncbi:MAG: ACT domain-containing protein [Gemmatimonadales bacterium]
MLTPVFTLDVLPGKLAICQLKPRAAFPKWIDRASTFLSINRTPTELSIVADEAVVPESVRAERGYRALRVKGPLQLDMVGVMAALSTPLAIAGVPVSVIATYDTDYLLVHKKHLNHARWALETAGHTVNDESQVSKAASF